MFSFRTLALSFCFATLAPAAMANSHRPVAVDVKETAVPSLPAHAQAARRATAALFDALRLSTAQVTRLQAHAEAELRDLALAITPDAAAAAERRYLLAVGRVLSPSQFAQYCALQASLETPLAYLQETERR